MLMQIGPGIVKETREEMEKPMKRAVQRLIKQDKQLTCFVVTINKVEDENFKASAVPG
jgi:hypothetical protein